MLLVIMKYCVLILLLSLPQFLPFQLFQVDSCIPWTYVFFFFPAFLSPFLSTSLFSDTTRCHYRIYYKMFIFSAPALESAISQRSPRYVWGHMLFSRNQDVGIGYSGFCYWGITISQFLQQAEPGNICMHANLWYIHLKLLLHLSIFIYIKLNLNSQILLTLP